MQRFGKGWLTIWLWMIVSVCFGQVVVRTEGANVFVNGVNVVSFKTASVYGLSAEGRATEFGLAVEGLPYFGEVKLRKVGKTHVVFAGGKRLVTITAAEAKAHGSTTAALGMSWSRKLRQAFLVPPLQVDTSPMLLPVPSTRTVKVSGSEFAEAIVESSDPAVVSVQKTATGLTLAVNSPGNATIRVYSTDADKSFEVTAQPYAALLPQTVAATVNGSPASGATIIGAVEGAIRTQLNRLPGSNVEISPTDVSSLADGQARTVPVKVRIFAPDAIERVGTVNVIVRNASLPYRKESELWYCNYPENVQSAGNLFAANLKINQPARMLYHHINESGSPLFIRIQAVNDSDIPARVVVMPGDGEPDKNPVRVGLRAASQYFRALTTGSGEVITIPPRSTLPISIRRLAPKETMSGLCGLRLIDGPTSVLVRTDAWPPFPLEPRWVAATNSPTPWRFVGCNPINEYDSSRFEISKHVYPNPFKTADVRYEVGKRFGFFKIGERPISGEDQRRVLDGNFGVVYNIRADISNPTPEPADIEIVFEASAGYSGCLFLVDGAYKESPLLQPKAEYRVERVTIPPGGFKRIELVTIPLSGSSYPSMISIRPFQVLSTGITSGGK